MARVLIDKEIHLLEYEQILLHELVFNENKQKFLQYCYTAIFSAVEYKNLFNIIKSLNGRCDLASVAKVAEEKHKYPVESTFNLLVSDPILKFWQGKYEVFNIIRALKETLFRRIVIERAGNLANIAEKSETDKCVNEVFSEVNKLITLERKLLKYERNKTEKIAELTSNKVNTQGDVVQAGLPFINKKLGGLTRKSISSLLARPKHLKSTFSDALVSSTVEKTDSVGLIISLEDPVEERVKRICASRLDISLKQMRFKEIRLEKEDVMKVLSTMMKNKLHIVDSQDVLTPEDAVSIINDIKPDIVAIDHIQKFDMSDMVIGIIRAVKSVEVAANRNNCHILITSQVGDKKFFQRESQAPTASDAQWTSALYQSSSEMFGLYYPYQVTHNPFESHILECHILAARYADAVGNFKLRINPDKAYIGEVIENK